MESQQNPKEIKVSVGIPALKLALDQTKGTIATQDAQVLLRNYLISGDSKKGTLTLLATDLDLASIGVCQAIVSDDFVLCVPGIKLVKIASLAAGDILTISIIGERVTLVAGKFKCELQGLPATDFPKFPDLESLEVSTISRELFLAYLRRISFSINDNVVKKNLLAVNIADGFIQASDGKVTTLCKCILSGKLASITIPAMAVPDLISVLAVSEEQDVLVSQSDAFLVFKIGESRFLARKSTAKFPDVLKLVVTPTEDIKDYVSFDKSEFKSAVQRVSIASDEKSLSISLELNQDSIRIFSWDLAGNKAEEIISAVWSGQSGIIYKFNYTYLLDIMDSLVADSVKLRIGDSLRLPVRFEDSDFFAFLMRLNA